MTAARPLVVYRDACFGVERSVPRHLLGFWEPSNRILATSDLVTYPCAPTLHEGAFTDCRVREVNARLEIGRIVGHPGLDDAYAGIVPVVEIEPAEDAVDAFRIHRWDEASRVRVQDRVRILMDPVVEGQVAGGVENDTRFICGVSVPMDLFEVRLEQALFQEAAVGAPVVTADDREKLLGMLVSVPRGRSYDGRRARCYPAEKGFGA